jgi:hypothetical protein
MKVIVFGDGETDINPIIVSPGGGSEGFFSR